MTEPVKLDLAAIRARADAASSNWALGLLGDDGANVKHSLTMDPSTTIVLLDMVERLTRERDEAREIINHGQTSALSETDRWVMRHSLIERTVQKQNDKITELRKRVAEIERWPG